MPVKFVINTHYHLDHVAGNRIFVDAGAVVLAQRNVRDWIHKSAGAIVDAVMPRLTAQYGQWNYFKYVARANILEMDAELRGKKRIPPAAPAK